MQLFTVLGRVCICHWCSDCLPILNASVSDVIKLKHGPNLVEVVKFGLELSNDEDNQKVEEVSESSDLAEQFGKAFDDAALNTDLLAQLEPHRKRTVVLRLQGHFNL